MDGIPERLRKVFEKTLNDDTLSEVEKVKQIYKDRSYVSMDDLAKEVFNKKTNWVRTRVFKKIKKTNDAL